jgi:transposase
MMLPDVPIFLCTEPVDMRRAFRGLSKQVVEVLGDDPRGGALFCFYNKRRDRLKLLWFDRNGYCLLYKHIERGTFRIPEAIPAGAKRTLIDPRELVTLLEGIELPHRKISARQIGRIARGKAEELLKSRLHSR